jgi:hypothetical protein
MEGCERTELTQHQFEVRHMEHCQVQTPYCLSALALLCCFGYSDKGGRLGLDVWYGPIASGSGVGTTNRRITAWTSGH